MRKFYQFDVCPYCWKVKAFLHYCGIEHAVVEVNPMTKAEIAFSSYKKVPILVDGETQINGSTAILAHLAEQDIDSRQRNWLDWTDQNLAPAIAAVMYSGFLRAWRSMKHVAAKSNLAWWQKPLVRYCGPLAMRRKMRRLADRHEDPEGELARAVAQWVKEGVAGKNFCGQDGPNMADFSVYGVLRAVAGTRVLALARENTQFSVWYDRCEEVMGRQRSLENCLPPKTK